MIRNGIPSQKLHVVHRVAEAFQSVGVVAEGSCIAAYRDLVGHSCPTDIQDIDVFWIKDVSVDEMRSILLKLSKSNHDAGNIPCLCSDTAYSVKFNVYIDDLYGEPVLYELNLVKRRGYYSALGIIKEFDLCNTVIHYDHIGQRFAGMLRAVSSNVLLINSCVHPTMLLQRLRKYEDKGFVLESETYAQLHCYLNEWYYVNDLDLVIQEEVADYHTYEEYNTVHYVDVKDTIALTETVRLRDILSINVSDKIIRRY